MKKMLCILLALSMVLCLAACNTNQQSASTPTAAPSPTEDPGIYIPTAEPAPERTATPAPVTPTPTLPPQIATPVEAPTPTPSTAPSITKSPTNESHKAGEQAVFVASANGWQKLSWRALSPNGLEISLRDFQQNFPTCTIDGAENTRLAIGNLSLEMNGWGFTCVFDNNGVSSRSETAFLTVTPGTETQTDPDSPETPTEADPDAPAVRNRYTCPVCGTLYDGSRCHVCGYSPYDADPYSGEYTDGSGYYDYGGYNGGYDIYAG